MRLRMTTMSAFSREILETISSWAEVFTALFGVLAATSAVVYLLANKPLRKIEAHENSVLQEKTATAQAEAAKAQLALSQTLAAFARRVGDRVLNFSTFVESLKGHPAK